VSLRSFSHFLRNSFRVSFRTGVCLWILLQGAGSAGAGVADAAGADDFCARGFSTIGNQAEASRLIQLPPPKFEALRRDLPSIEDPLAFIQDFNQRRASWNQLHPTNRNNFSVPKMKGGVDMMIRSLKKVKRPPENRIAAQNFVRDLENLKRQGLPYRDSILKLHEASEILALKQPSRPDIVPGRRQIFDRAKFEEAEGKDREALSEMLETEIFIPTHRNQTVEGLAESTLLGLRAVQVVNSPAVIDRRWMNARERLEHDIAHAMVPTRDALSRAVVSLPLESRVRILSQIDLLPTKRERTLARFSIYQTAHEYAGDSQIPLRFTEDSVRAVQTEFRDAFEGNSNDMSEAEVKWLQKWYADTVGAEILDSSRPKARGNR